MIAGVARRRRDQGPAQAGADEAVRERGHALAARPRAGRRRPVRDRGRPRSRASRSRWSRARRAAHRSLTRRGPRPPARAGRGRSPAARGRAGCRPKLEWRPGLDLWGPQRFRVVVGGQVVGETTGNSLVPRRRLRAGAAAHVPGDRDRLARAGDAEPHARGALRQRRAEGHGADRRQAPRGPRAADRRARPTTARARACREMRVRYGDPRALVSQRGKRFRGGHVYRRGPLHAARDGLRQRRQPPGQDRAAAHLVRLRAGRRELELGGPPLLMGVVNATPDSFSDARRASPTSRRGARGRAASRRAPRSSTSAASRRSAGRPPVAVDEEIERVVPLSSGSPPSTTCSSRSTPTSRRSRRRRSRRARAWSTTSRACATRRSPRCARAPARRSCSCTRGSSRRGRCSIPAPTTTSSPTSSASCAERMRRARSRRGGGGADRARPGARLRQDAGADRRGAAAARRAARARAPAAAGGLAQGLPRRDHRPRGRASAGAGDARGARRRRATPGRASCACTTSPRRPTSSPCGRCCEGERELAPDEGLTPDRFPER